MGLSKSLFVILFALLTAVSAVNGSGEVAQSSSSKLIKLDDTNFEHLTQASTGSTTGDWFILFHDSKKRSRTLLEKFEHIADELAGEVNVAAMLSSESSQSLTRLRRIGKSDVIPYVAYLQHGMVYPYTDHFTLENLLQFANYIHENRQSPEIESMGFVVPKQRLLSEWPEDPYEKFVHVLMLPPVYMCLCGVGGMFFSIGIIFLFFGDRIGKVPVQDKTGAQQDETSKDTKKTQ